MMAIFNDDCWFIHSKTFTAESNRIESNFIRFANQSKIEMEIANADINLPTTLLAIDRPKKIAPHMIEPRLWHRMVHFCVGNFQHTNIVVMEIIKNRYTHFVAFVLIKWWRRILVSSLLCFLFREVTKWGHQRIQNF